MGWIADRFADGAFEAVVAVHLLDHLGVRADNPRPIVTICCMPGDSSPSRSRRSSSRPSRPSASSTTRWIAELDSGPFAAGSAAAGGHVLDRQRVVQQQLLRRQHHAVALGVAGERQARGRPPTST
jgi:hypothetical protein